MRGISIKSNYLCVNNFGLIPSLTILLLTVKFTPQLYPYWWSSSFDKHERLVSCGLRSYIQFLRLPPTSRDGR